MTTRSNKQRPGRFEWVEMTPRKALHLLEKNHSNRVIRPLHVDRLAHDMVNDNWLDTGVPIIVDEHGQLIDGQHRLKALIQADRTILMPVCYGVSTRVGIVLDDGAKRSLVDAARFAKCDYIDRRMAGFARSMYLGLCKDWRSTSTRTDMLQFVQQHKKALLFAIEVLSPHIKGVTIAPVGAVFARAWYHEEHERLRRAGMIIVKGAPDDNVFMDGDRTLLALVRFMQSSSEFHGSDAQRQKYAKSERALRAFLDYTDLQAIYMTQKELFPISGEKDDEV